MQVYSFEIQNDERGVLQKLEIIAESIKKGAQNTNVRFLTLDLIQDLPDQDFYSELERIYYWVCNNIRYVRDIDGVETIHDAEKLLEIKAGDCDDFVILLGSMLKSVGFPIQIVIFSQDGINFSHIYLRTYCNGKWINCDASMKAELGKPVPGIKRYFSFKE